MKTEAPHSIPLGGENDTGLAEPHDPASGRINAEDNTPEAGKQREAYLTKDLSLVRELLHPAAAELRHLDLGMSLAEAVVEESALTASHRHEGFDEIYYCLEGAGVLYLGGEEHEFFPHSFYLIPRGTPHHLKAITRLRLLCVCAPGYTHEDTIVLE